MPPPILTVVIALVVSIKKVCFFRPSQTQSTTVMTYKTTQPYNFPFYTKYNIPWCLQLSRNVLALFLQNTHHKLHFNKYWKLEPTKNFLVKKKVSKLLMSVLCNDVPNWEMIILTPQKTNYYFYSQEVFSHVII